MAHRIFRDEHGVEWEAWDVYPQLPDRWTGQAPDRERTAADRRFVGEALQQGWLCFRSSAEKRRATPIPADWVRLSSSELARVCQRASVVPPASGWRLVD